MKKSKLIWAGIMGAVLLVAVILVARLVLGMIWSLTRVGEQLIPEDGVVWVAPTAGVEAEWIEPTDDPDPTPDPEALENLKTVPVEQTAEELAAEEAE